jgi:hypothetical protein
VVLQLCLLPVGSVLVADFFRVVEVVPARLGLVPELLLVGSIPVVGFFQVAVVVPVEWGLILVPKKVAWN